MQRRETLIACGGHVAPFPFKVGEKAPHDGRVDLLDRDPDWIGLVVFGDIAEQQAYGVAVAFLGVEAEVAVRDQVLKEKSADKGSHQVISHYHYPLLWRRRNARNASTPR